MPQVAAVDREIPDLRFGLYDGLAALEHSGGKLYLVATGVARAETEVLDRLQARVDAARAASVAEPQPPALGAGSGIQQGGIFAGGWSGEGLHCPRGRVPGQSVAARALPVPRQCRAIVPSACGGTPAPYSAYIDAGELTVLSTSPEQFLRKRGRQLETRPIKGTRPRGRTPESDRRNAAELRQSVKDRAELLMIVDLERNDLGRVAEFGSVEVEGLYNLENYARVMHQTARVKATLASGRDVFDCIRALFPGGSITGALKVRAMEIIEELEPTRRGVYCGSVGYIGFDGDAELNIAIRSLHLAYGYLDYQVGGGIVWDSDPESEFRETLDKGRAIRETLDALCQSH